MTSPVLPRSTVNMKWHSETTSRGWDAGTRAQESATCGHRNHARRGKRESLKEQRFRIQLCEFWKGGLQGPTVDLERKNNSFKEVFKQCVPEMGVLWVKTL